MSAQQRNFEGTLQADNLSGEVAITVGKDALLFVGSLGQLTCFYSDIQAFSIENYVLVIDSTLGQLRVFKMGDALDWLFDSLWCAYNDAVQRALFVDGSALYESNGAYCYEDAGGRSEGLATIRLFDNCICILPPHEAARRIPFCFVEDIKEENYSLRLTLDTGEWYMFQKLGGYKEGFVYQLTLAMQAQQKKTQEALQEICAGLGSVELTAIARLMREGVSAPVDTLHALSPAFVEAIDKQISQSRAAAPYAFFKTICNPQDICVGIKKSEKESALPAENDQTPQKPDELPATTRQPSELPSGLDEQGASEESSPYVIFIAASKTGSAPDRVAAVELAIPEQSSAATFIYRYQGEWAVFGRKLNRAMEAVSFRREVIWLDEDALNKPEHAHYRMAIARTEALRFLRSCFAGRVIHSSPEAWQRDILHKFGR